MKNFLINEMTIIPCPVNRSLQTLQSTEYHQLVSEYFISYA